MPGRVTLQAVGAIYTMRTCTDATKAQIAALDVFPHTWGTWLQGALSDCYHDKPMSLQRERRMCEALGIEAPPPEYAVPACPGCGGEPHVGACHGNGGQAVVLADGETVTKRKPRQYSRIVDMPTSMLARAIRERQAVPGMEGKVQL